MSNDTQSPDVTIYAKAADPLTPVVVQYMNEHSGCNVTTKYIDQDASDASDDAEKGLRYPRIHVGNKYFGGVGCLDMFPLKVTDHRLKEITGEVDEPMTREDKEFDRLILFNGKNEHEWEDMYTLYKKELANFWIVEEIDTSTDLEHWNNLNEGEQHFLKMILAFFASGDQIVMENCTTNFGSEILVPQGLYKCGLSDLILGEESGVVIHWPPRLIHRAARQRALVWHTHPNYADPNIIEMPPSVMDCFVGLHAALDLRVDVDQLIVTRTGLWRLYTRFHDVARLSREQLEEEIHNFQYYASSIQADEYIEARNAEVDVPLQKLSVQAFVDMMNRNIEGFSVEFHPFYSPSHHPLVST
eukprot:g15477.t1